MNAALEPSFLFNAAKFTPLNEFVGRVVKLYKLYLVYTLLSLMKYSSC